ncbi:MAG: GntR family transcriptional regulator [Kiritimatiellia bacterium]
MNLTQQSYSKIRQKLLAADAAGGRRLSINKLAAQLGIGRSPVRDAVNRLAAEGLLLPVAKSGVVIRSISLRELREIVQLREALEPYAAAQAGPRIPRRQTQQMRRCLGEMTRLARKVRDTRFRDEALNHALYQADRRLHTIILEAAGNALLQKIVVDHQLLLRKVRYPSIRTTPHLARTLLEHWRIYRALARRDAAGARCAMLKHTRSGARAALASWQKVNRPNPDSMNKSETHKASGQLS